MSQCSQQLPCMVPVSLGSHPSLLPGFLSQCTEKVHSQCPCPDRTSVTSSLKSRGLPLWFLFLPVLLFSFYFVLFTLPCYFPVPVVWLQYHVSQAFTFESFFSFITSMKNLPATAHTLFNQIYPRRFALAYYRAYAENNWMPKVCGNVQGLENPWGCLCAEFCPPAGWMLWPEWGSRSTFAVNMLCKLGSPVGWCLTLSLVSADLYYPRRWLVY